MENITKWSGVVALVILAILYFVPHGSMKLGAVSGTTTYDNIGLLTLKVGTTCNDGFGYAGCNGTQIARINSGQCFFAPAGTTITASTTVAVDCQATAMISTTAAAALTGVTLGDNVQVTISTTTSQVGYGGLLLAGASASSTSGYITLRIYNATGGTFTWPVVGTASGTASYLVTK